MAEQNNSSFIRWQVGLFTFGSLFLFIIIMLGFAQQLPQMAN